MAAVDQAVIDLIADDEQIMLLGKRGERADAVGVQDRAGGVVGKADEQRLSCAPWPGLLWRPGYLLWSWSPVRMQRRSDRE
jgi:hypothetical protein